MEWDFVYSFLYLPVLLLAVVLSYRLGLRQGKSLSSINSSKQKLQSRKNDLARFAEERFSYLKEINVLSSELEDARQKSELYDEKQKQLKLFRQKLLVCEQQIKELQADGFYEWGINVVRNINENPQSLSLSRKEWNEFLHFSDEVFGSFLTSLNLKYDLTLHDQELCCMIKWGIGRKQQLIVFNNTSDALTKSRNRLKKRLLLKESEELDEFVLLYR